MKKTLSIVFLFLIFSVKCQAMLFDETAYVEEPGLNLNLFGQFNAITYPRDPNMRLGAFGWGEMNFLKRFSGGIGATIGDTFWCSSEEAVGVGNTKIQVLKEGEILPAISCSGFILSDLNDFSWTRIGIFFSKDISPWYKKSGIDLSGLALPLRLWRFQILTALATLRLHLSPGWSTTDFTDYENHWIMGFDYFSGRKTRIFGYLWLGDQYRDIIGFKHPIKKSWYLTGFLQHAPFWSTGLGLSYKPRISANKNSLATDKHGFHE